MSKPQTTFDSPYRPAPLSAWLSQNPIKTLPQLFAQAVQRNRHQDFLGAKVAGSYLYQTYGDIDKRAHELSAALLSLGVEPADRIAQLSSNRPEWVIFDLATMRIGGIHVPLYTDQTDASLLHHLKHSQSRLLLVETDHQLQMVLRILKDLPHLTTIISHAEPSSEKTPVTFLNFQSLLDMGAQQLSERREEIEKRSHQLRGEDVCSLVYTSGTTGEPKGVMLMHGNFVSNALGIKSRVDAKPGEIALSILPLSHVLERSILYLAISVGGTVAFAESQKSIPANLLEVRPHFLAGVPRLYEKVLEKVQRKLNSEKTMPRMKRRLFEWALNQGSQLSSHSPNEKLGRLLKFRHRLAEKSVLRKIKQKMGGRIRALASGGAPLAAEVARFYRAVGFQLVEGYGLTETSPVVTMSALLYPVPETVGKPLSHVHIRLEEDGEISVRGPNVMLGYFRDPKATAKVIDEEGWFRTGDLGHISGTGHLSITGRKKDLIVLSSGKNLAPSPIEQRLLQDPLIEQVLLVGDQEKFLSALIVCQNENCQAWLAKQKQFQPGIALWEQAHLKREILNRIVRCCQELPSYQRVKKIALVDRAFSAEFGEVTPTLKLKRSIIVKNFAAEIRAIYQE